MEILNIKDVALNQKELEIKVDKATFDAEVDKAFKKNVGKINVPGFRKGKAPRAMIEKMYGKGVFYEDALNALIPGVYEEALEASKLEVVSRPDFDVKSIDEGGVVLTAKVFVKPEITVTEYKGLKGDREKVEITDEAVDKEIDRVRERNSRIIEVSDRPAKTGDEVVLDFDGYVDGKQFDGGKAEKHNLKLGSGQFIPGFEDQVAGKSIGEDFDVNVTFPEDYQEKTLAGKAAVFKCKIHEIKETELPELNDEFVKDVSEFDTVDEYKADVKAKLEKDANKAADQKLDEQLMDALSANIVGEIPDVMYENETENIISDYESRLRYQGLTLEMFMKYTGQDMEALKKQFRPQAEKQVKTRLALEYVAKVEGLEATDEDVEEEYKKISEGYGVDVEKVKEAIKADAVKADIVVGKAVLLVRDNASVAGAKKKTAAKKSTKKAAPAEEAPAEAAPAEEAAEAPKKKTTRKSTKKTEEKPE
ncbi:MAG: trigger factor [Clostridia bacterium]|nr:trigger factor [Clostridia bacterium]